MASGSGFGRGGRGAALRQALVAANARKPGDAEEVLEQSASESKSCGAKPGPAAPMGRGSLLAGLRQSMLASQQAKEAQDPVQARKEDVRNVGPEGDADGEMLKSSGRGLAAFHALIAQKNPQSTTSMGRGFCLQAKAADSSALTEVPERKMAAMNIQSEEKKPSSPSSAGQPEGRRKYPSFDAPRAPPINKQGNTGNEMELTANYIRILCANKSVYQYHVHFNPPIDNKRLRIGLLAEHKDLVKSLQGFDGNQLFIPFELPQKEMNLTSTRRTDGEKVSLTITFVKELPMERMCHLFNIMFRRIMFALKMCQVGKYFYNPHTPACVPQHKLEVWPGYITAAKEYEGGLMLCLDASHRVLRTETVLDVMESIVRTNSQDYQDRIFAKLVGQTVLTRYNNKHYRIDDIVWNKSPTDKFSTSDGKEISFCEYYKTQYNIKISSLQQPLLVNKVKPPKFMPPEEQEQFSKFVCLIPELCYITGLTDDIRKDFRVMKDLSVHTRVTPAQRQNAMKKFIQTINQTPEAASELKFWGLRLDSNTVPISGRLMMPEKIKMASKEFPSGDQADWNRHVGRSELLTSVNFTNWGVFFVRRDAKKANDFISTLQAETGNLGIRCSAPFRCELGNDKIECLLQELRRYINAQVQIVVVINPTMRADRYGAIKKLCCVEAPVASQVINANTISKPDKLRSIVQKIAMQMNCKLGGELWAVHIPFEKLCVVGIDTYHDASKGRNSIAGLVSSLNRSCTKWFSKVCFQKPGQELVHGLQICLTAGLKKFHEVNHFLPDRIVIFRDGVGDGQIPVVRDHEVQQLKRCFASFGDYQPQCVTVIVQKRINTRIYSKDRSGRTDNPPPGTVVDHTVTRRDEYDFFIVSQHVRQGTVSPTHYIVVDDAMNLHPDKMQRLTYKMTHLYYNWPGTVRVPAPCQYAHKLAYLVGENVHKEPSESLSDRLYFL